MTSGRYIPAHAVARPALLRRLDEALTRPITLVVALAGAGKSVLLTQWIASLSVPSAWLDITDADNDPEYFVRHLQRSLGHAQPGISSTDQTVHLAGPVLAPHLVDDVEAALADSPERVVVLDDLHNIRNPVLLADLETLLTRLPPTVHVVLSSRTDPPIRLSRSRLRDEVGEIRQSELALNERESAALIYAVSHVRLGEESVAALVERTEGWAAGLQLAAMTLRHHSDPLAFVAQFSGSDRLVADYLSEQVVRSLSEDLRALLFSMAALDRMSSDLVAHVSDDPGAKTALTELEQASMFLVPLDDRQEWFRFHQLFRDLLRFQARAHDPDAEKDVLRRAAQWHLERGDWEPAVEYLLRAQEWDAAIALILARGSDVFERSENASVVSAILRIPETLRDRNIDLSLLLGILIGITGRADEADDILRRLAADSTASVGQRACAEAFLATLAQWRPDAAASLYWAERALSTLQSHPDAPLPDILRLTDAQSLRTMATVSGGRAHFQSGNIDEARRWLQRGLSSPGAAYSLWRISALASLALLEAWVGRMRLAEGLAIDALAVANAVSAERHPATSEAHLALGLVALERGDETYAAQAMEDGWLRADANGRTQVAWIFYAASRALNPPLSGHDVPPGHPPRIASERLETIARRGVHPQGWVSARTDPVPGTQWQSRDGGAGAFVNDLADPLTERELEILAYLPSRITTTELAARCYVSVNTVKTHIAHIYQKLEVSSRGDAITRATELGLLRW